MKLDFSRWLINRYILKYETMCFNSYPCAMYLMMCQIKLSVNIWAFHVKIKNKRREKDARMLYLEPCYFVVKLTFKHWTHEYSFQPIPTQKKGLIEINIKKYCFILFIFNWSLSFVKKLQFNHFVEIIKLFATFLPNF